MYNVMYETKELRGLVEYNKNCEHTKLLYFLTYLFIVPL